MKRQPPVVVSCLPPARARARARISLSQASSTILLFSVSGCLSTTVSLSCASLCLFVVKIELCPLSLLSPLSFSASEPLRLGLDLLSHGPDNHVAAVEVAPESGPGPACLGGERRRAAAASRLALPGPQAASPRNATRACRESGRGRGRLSACRPRLA